MTLPFITTDEAKAFSDLPSNLDAALTTRLALVMATAASQIEQATGRAFARQEYTEFFNTRRTAYQGSTLRYDTLSEEGAVGAISGDQQYRLKGINFDQSEGNEPAVYYDPLRQFGADTLQVAGTDYEIVYDTLAGTSATRGSLYIRRGTAEVTRGIKVVYTAGYESGDMDVQLLDMPTELKTACALQSAFLLRRFQADNIGKRGISGADSERSRVSFQEWNSHVGLCQEALSMVSPYKLLRLGRG